MHMLAIEEHKADGHYELLVCETIEKSAKEERWTKVG